MNRVLFLATIICTLMNSVCLRAAALSPPPVRFAGQNYVPLEKWSAGPRLVLRWLKSDDELRLTNQTSTLDFKVNTQRAGINGIGVFLSFPVLLYRGEAYVSAKDVDLVLNPIVRPAKNKFGQRIRTVAISAGHGGHDPGNLAGAEQEKNYTLALAREVKDRLAKVGIKVVMIRDEDKFIDLDERVQIAKRAKADLYVGLHYNSATGDGAHGSEVYCLTPVGIESTNGGAARSRAEAGDRNHSRNMLLAYLLQKRLVQHIGFADRGVRRASFVVLRLAQMPAVLVEAGFMSNPEELRRIKDAERRGRVAQAVVDGILAYKREVEP